MGYYKGQPTNAARASNILRLEKSLNALCGRKAESLPLNHVVRLVTLLL